MSDPLWNGGRLSSSISLQIEYEDGEFIGILANGYYVGKSDLPQFLCTHHRSSFTVYEATHKIYEQLLSSLTVSKQKLEKAQKELDELWDAGRFVNYLGE